MYKKICTVNEPYGICARPASRIVSKSLKLLGVNNTGKVYLSKIDENDEFFKEAGEADVLSIMSIMMLVATYKTRLAVWTIENEFQEAVDEIAKLINEIRIE